MKQLIELAESKGFTNNFWTSEDEEDISDEDKYILLCLIQKWIYEKFGIWIEVTRLSVSFWYRIIDDNYIGPFSSPNESLKEGIKKALELIRLMPEYGDNYFYVSVNGSVEQTGSMETNGDSFRYKTRNCFKTKEEAEEELERILFVNEVRDFIEDENGGVEIDWNNEDQNKHYMSYSYFSDKFFIQITGSLKPVSDYKYFLNRSTYDKILAKFDNSKLIKWWI